MSIPLDLQPLKTLFDDLSLVAVWRSRADAKAMDLDPDRHRSVERDDDRQYRYERRVERGRKLDAILRRLRGEARQVCEWIVVYGGPQATARIFTPNVCETVGRYASRRFEPTAFHWRTPQGRIAAARIGVHYLRAALRAWQNEKEQKDVDKT